MARKAANPWFYSYMSTKPFNPYFAKDLEDARKNSSIHDLRVIGPFDSMSEARTIALRSKRRLSRNPAANPKRTYVGIAPDLKRSVFHSDFEPTQKSHGERFAAIIGPFKTVRGAKYMARYGQGNIHLQDVSAAERLARLEKGRNRMANPFLYSPQFKEGDQVHKVKTVSIYPDKSSDKLSYMAMTEKAGSGKARQTGRMLVYNPSAKNPELMVMLNGRRRGRRNPVAGVTTIGELVRLQEHEDKKPFSMKHMLSKKDWTHNVAKELGIETPSKSFLKSLDPSMPVEVLTSFMHKAKRNPRRRSRLSVRRRRSAPTIRYKGRRWYFLALRAKFGQRRAKSIWRKSRKTMRNRGGRMTSGRPKLSPKGMAYKRRKRLAKQLGISANRRRTRRKLLVARN